MCRLFGFKSVLESGVHSSLLSADNALLNQSQHHPDGWGVAYYLDDFPHLIRSANSAMNCSIFKRVSGTVSSNTVLAHIRKATEGNKTILNTHPFQFSNWVFAHNGNIKDFEQKKSELHKLIDHELFGFILGDTDSEVLFFIILSQLKEDQLLKDNHNNQVFEKSIRKAIKKITDICGQYYSDPKGPDTENYYSFLMTNGTSMFAFNGGKELFFSTYKTLCPERDVCPKLSPECEAPTKSGYVNHLLFSSEPLSGENVWDKMKPAEMIIIDAHMVFNRFI
jgi:glutamine amidotransferase